MTVTVPKNVTEVLDGLLGLLNSTTSLVKQYLPVRFLTTLWHYGKIEQNKDLLLILGKFDPCSDGSRLGLHLRNILHGQPEQDGRALEPDQLGRDWGAEFGQFLA